MNALKERIRKLEKQLKSKGRPVFIWADNTKEAERELEKLSPGERETALIFSWEGEVRGPKGPTGPIDNKLSPELQKKQPPKIHGPHKRILKPIARPKGREDSNEKA